MGGTNILRGVKGHRGITRWRVLRVRGSWVSGRSLGLLVSCNGVPGPIIRSSANLNTVLIPLGVC